MLPRWYYKLSLALLIVAVFNTVTISSVASRPLYTVTNIVVSSDTFVRSLGASDNYDTSSFISIGEFDSSVNNYNISYVRYDLSSIPTNAVISSVVLDVTLASDFSSTVTDVQIKSLVAPYVPTTVTWTNKPGPNNLLGSLTFSATETINTHKQFSLDVSYFQNVLSGFYNNTGLGIYTTVDLNDGWRIHSLENGNSSYYPTLIFTYTVPTATPTFTSTPMITPTSSSTPTLTPVFTFTNTPNFTLTFSLTPAITETFTPVPTETGTALPPTVTNTPTPTGFPTEIDFPYYLLLILPLLFIDWQTALIWCISAVTPMISDFFITLPFQGFEIWMCFLIVAFMRRFLFTSSR